MLRSISFMYEAYETSFLRYDVYRSRCMLLSIYIDVLCEITNFPLPLHRLSFVYKTSSGFRLSLDLWKTDLDLFVDGALLHRYRILLVNVNVANLGNTSLSTADIFQLFDSAKANKYFFG
ncbi:hypothetical protein [Sphingobacterium griseoflavum]|uniref:hypothetical protein n=1 Tax=Sphingobacterium griseoflavum TaxID=1474952 RepID=UPI0016730F90|nr:hypothetical protein [Sphingobacterium griseoflavum]